MTNRATLEALLARVLEGTGPDRELDAEIAKAFGWIERYEIWWPPEIVKLAQKRKRAIYNYKMYSLIQMRRYTASLDAALTLVPERWDWRRRSNLTMALVYGESEKYDLVAVHHEPCRALIAACIKARMEALGE